MNLSQALLIYVQLLHGLMQLNKKSMHKVTSNIQFGDKIHWHCIRPFRRGAYNLLSISPPRESGLVHEAIVLTPRFIIDFQEIPLLALHPRCQQ